jgi:chemotaxis protein CheD
MWETEIAVPEIYVLPGESHLVKEPTILRTVLGSCVGIAFLVPRLGLGALCHPMLPLHPGRRASELGLAHSRRYVDFAIQDLARQFDALGVRRSEAQVKLFGGGDVLMASSEWSRPTVGNMNCESALRVLQEEGFQVAASSLGGTAGLTIKFHTGTGEVLLRRLG